MPASSTPIRVYVNGLSPAQRMQVAEMFRSQGIEAVVEEFQPPAALSSVSPSA